MKVTHFILAAITLLFTMMNSSCGGGDDKDAISPVLKPSDINLGPHLIEYSAHWLTNGQTLTIEIKDLDYSTAVPGVNLSSIKIEKDGEVITTTPYKKNSPINIKIDGWSHGENTLKVIAVFKSNDGEAEKEIRSSNFIVFNEIPKYDIEGWYMDEIKWIASSGEVFFEYIEDISKGHVFDKYVEISWLASSGEYFQYTNRPNNPTFFINEDATNFDAEITKAELHWHTQDGPAELTKEEELTYPVKLFVDFTVSGVHEGIAISQETTIVFSFIKK